MRAMRMLLAAGLAVMLFAGLFAGAAAAQEDALPPQQWSFSGPFGTYDRAAAQRGFAVYKQVCSNCHSLNLAYYRDLEGIGFSAEQVKAIAASVQIPDISSDGQPSTRPGLPSDHFKAPFPNEEAAKAANNGAAPPDQSVLVNARDGHATYAADLVGQGYVDPPAGTQIPPGSYYNKYFPGHYIHMPPPLQADEVTYADGTKATVQQEAHDVATFLMYIANPHLEERKRTGVKVVVFLVLLAGVTYAVKRQVWSDVH